MTTTRFLSLALTLAAAGVTTTIVPAQGPPPAPQRDPAARAEFIRKFDKDGDGRVSREEIERARASGELKGSGKRNQGSESPSGREAAGSKGQRPTDLQNDRRIQKLLDEFDLDRNGKLNFDEMAACREAMKERREDAGTPTATEPGADVTAGQPEARPGEGARRKRPPNDAP